MPKTQIRKPKKDNNKMFQKDNDENVIGIKTLQKGKLKNLAKKEYSLLCVVLGQPMVFPRIHQKCTYMGRTRARQPGPRCAGLLDALRATVHWLSVADGRRPRSEDREPRREAGRLTGRLRDLPCAEQ